MTSNHLWAFLSNGRRLRVLRDNASLTRQAFVEFDVEAMMDGEVYADFSLLWLLCHESRVPVENPADCWLERWSKTAQEQGTRALDHLRAGVETAITALGRGFLDQPANAALRDALRAERLTRQDYYRQLLRIVYRLLFLFVAEDRGVLLDPSAAEAARRRFSDFYATAGLRRLAERRRGTRHVDLYIGLNLVMERLGTDTGCPELGLPALGSFLWSPDAVRDLAGCQIANHDLLDAIRALAFTIEGSVRRPIDYKNLGSEELGSVYESLLELHPVLSVDAGAFVLETAGGNERKTTGSYYTPSSLIARLLDSALDPVLDEAARKPDPETAILSLRVCDPACGSGHFLVAAAHRIARRLASVRTGDEEPPPGSVRKALRDVIGQCVYGVDINPMAVELCKVSLWMDALEPGKPLSFLDAHIQVGNSLLGATPALLRRGIPDEAFEPIEGDDKAACRELRKKNRDERRGQATMFDRWDAPAWERLGNLAPVLAGLAAIPDDTIAGIHAKEQRYAELVRSSSYESATLWADAWCAAFVVRKERVPDLTPRVEVTERVFRAIEENPHQVSKGTKDEVARLARHYRFFHWHLAFPDVFQPVDHVAGEDILGWQGGFDVVLGNPPWERIKLQEQEWFAERRPEIAKAANAAARRKMIAQLSEHDPALYQAFLDDRRRTEGESHFVRHSGRYPLCGRGDVNTYTIFAETTRHLIRPEGRVGCIVPSGIATDDTTKFFFQDLIRSRSLASLYSFENEEFLFPGVHHSTKFCLLSLSGSESHMPQTEFVFFARRVEHLDEKDRRFTLSADDIALMNPNTGTCPIFRSKKDADINKAIYRRVPVLIREGTPEINPWSITFHRMLDMASDSGLFRTQEQLEADDWVLDGKNFRKGEAVYLPLFEAKMVHHFDHRFGTYEGQTDAQANQGKLPELDDAQHGDPQHTSLPWYWVPGAGVEQRLRDRWGRNWLIGWRDVCRNTDTRTAIASLLPVSGVGDKFLLMFPIGAPPSMVACLLANVDSFMFDYCCRQKIGGTALKYFIMRQLPALPPRMYEDTTPWHPGVRLGDWVFPRVLELTYTAWDLQPFARDCGYNGPPFRWDAARRFLLRCEIDAAFFHLYGLNRDDVAYVLESFPVVRKRDEAKYGEYRTAQVILEVYDRMAEATLSGVSYESLLDPPPGPPALGLPEWLPGEKTPVGWPDHIHPPRHVRVRLLSDDPGVSPQHADPVPRSTIASIQSLQIDRITSYIVLLLREWKKPVGRNVLEAALVLMLNDGVRAKILARSPSAMPEGPDNRIPEYVRGLDGLLDELQKTGFIGVETANSRQNIRLGPAAPNTADAPEQDITMARETLDALAIVGEDRISDILPQFVTQSYELVS